MKNKFSPSVFSLTFTLLALSLHTPSAVAMDWEKLPSSTNIEDRHGVDPSFFVSEDDAAAESHFSIDDWKNFFLDTRSSLIKSADQAASNSFPFNCPQLSKYSAAVIDLGKSLRYSKPDQIFPGNDQKDTDQLMTDIKALDPSEVCGPKGAAIQAALENEIQKISGRCDAFTQISQTASAKKIYENILSDKPQLVSRPLFGLFPSKEADCADATRDLFKTLDKVNAAAVGFCNIYSSVISDIEGFQDDINEARAESGCGAGAKKAHARPVSKH
jgi:hypothetical protein